MLFLNCFETFLDGDGSGTDGAGCYLAGLIRCHFPGYTNDHISDFDVRSWESDTQEGLWYLGPFDLIGEDHFPMGM